MILNKEPRNDTDKHKCKEVNRERRVLKAVEVNLNSLQGLDSDRKGEPVNKNSERGLNNRPERTDNGALVGLDKLVLSQQDNLLSKALVLLKN